MTVDQRLADLLAPTLNDGPGLIFDCLGRICVIPLSDHPPRDLADACALYHVLGRGLLVLA